MKKKSEKKLVVKEQKIFVGRIEDFKMSKHNPSGRTEGSSGLNRLREGIADVGLIYPLACEEDMTIIDGHRRWQCCKDLGWETIPYLIVPNEDPDRVFASVTTCTERLSGNQTLQVWFKRPEAVSASSRRSFERLEEMYGKEMLARICKSHQSIRIFGIAKGVTIYTGQDETFTPKVIMWLLKWKNQSFVRAYMRLQQPPRTLLNAILKRTDIKAKFSS